MQVFLKNISYHLRAQLAEFPPSQRQWLNELTSFSTPETILLSVRRNQSSMKRHGAHFWPDYHHYSTLTSAPVYNLLSCTKLLWCCDYLGPHTALDCISCCFIDVTKDELMQLFMYLFLLFFSGPGLRVGLARGSEFLYLFFLFVWSVSVHL